MHLQENTLYGLKLVVKVTQNVVQYPPNHVTFARAKFEGATTNSLGEDGFTINYITVKPRLFEVPGTAGILSNNR